MTLALVLLSLTVLLLVAVLIAAAAWARRLVRARDASGLQALVGARVVANVADGPAIRGVLERVYTDAIVIAHPEFIGTSRPANIGSTITLQRSAVPMLQRFDDRPLAAVDQAVSG